MKKVAILLAMFLFCSCTNVDVETNKSKAQIENSGSIEAHDDASYGDITTFKYEF